MSPYIKKERRSDILLNSDSDRAKTIGELNFLITMDILDYLADRTIGYSDLNSIIGVLECVKMELYRRVVVPYEQKRMAENGDVFDV